MDYWRGQQRERQRIPTGFQGILELAIFVIVTKYSRFGYFAKLKVQCDMVERIFFAAYELMIHLSPVRETVTKDSLWMTFKPVDEKEIIKKKTR